MMGRAVKAYTEVGRTADRLASVAGADNFRLPIGLRLVKPTLRSATFRDGGPGLLGTGYGGDEASLWERDVARVPGFPFLH